MHILEKIENEFGFKYPELYRQLYKEKMLDWGIGGSNWYYDSYPKIKDNPPFLLYAKDFKMLNLNRVLTEIECLNKSERYGKINPIYKFVPFATNTAHDLYCFLYTEEFDNDVPVVLVWHDGKYAEIKSKNLNDFIFRELLEAVEDIWADSLILEGNFKVNILNIFKTHKKYLAKAQQKIIKAIYALDLFDSYYKIKLPKGGQKEEKTIGLLTYETINEILITEITFDLLNTTFDYTISELPVESQELNKKEEGKLIIKIYSVPPFITRTSDVLKALNWREQKTDVLGAVEYYRNGNIIFGIPLMATIDEDFRKRLQSLKSNFPNIEVVYQDNSTRTIYEL